MQTKTQTPLLTVKKIVIVKIYICNFIDMFRPIVISDIQNAQNILVHYFDSLLYCNTVFTCLSVDYGLNNSCTYCLYLFPQVISTCDNLNIQYLKYLYSRVSIIRGTWLGAHGISDWYLAWGLQYLGLANTRITLEKTEFAKTFQVKFDLQQI